MWQEFISACVKEMDKVSAQIKVERRETSWTDLGKLMKFEGELNLENHREIKGKYIAKSCTKLNLNYLGRLVMGPLLLLLDY